jgi:tetratricopeptide (TPR) repeat protein
VTGADRGRLATGLLYAVALLAVFTIALSSLTEFDFWWYLASAERILAARSVPDTDPFSYTAEGRPWINHMWATQLLLWAGWQTGGPLVLILAKAILVAATFGVVLATMRRRGVHPVMAAAVTLVAAWAGWEFWDVRPQLVTYLLLAVYLHLLREGWEARPRTLGWLPVLMVPWANLHAGFLTGLAVIGLVGLGTAVPRLLDQGRRRDGWRALRLAAAAGVVTALASLLNPFGLRAILFPLEVVNTRLFMSTTAEWLSPNFHDPAYLGFEVMLLVLVPAFAWGRHRLGATDVLVTLVFTHLALSSSRHLPLFAVAVAPLLADALEAAVRDLWARRPAAWDVAGLARRHFPTFWPRLVSPGAPAAALTTALVVGLVPGWASLLEPIRNPFIQDLNELRYPGETMRFIRDERLPAPLFNSYAWAGYELWRLYPEYRMFIDGRTHVYGADVLQDFVEINNLGARWRTVLDKWRIQTILTERTSALAQALGAVGGWRLVFTEREAAVFVREADEHRALLARLPARPLAVPWPDVVEPLLAGLAAAEAGDDERAVRHYREALRRFPDHPVALLSLGLLRERQGRAAEARTLFERILAVHPQGETVEAARARLERLR